VQYGIEGALHILSKGGRWGGVVGGAGGDVYLYHFYSSQCLSLQDPSPDVYSPPGTARARAPFSPPGSPSRGTGVPGADRTPSRSSLKRPVSVPVSVAADVVTVHPADPVAAAGAAAGAGAGVTVRFGGADELEENEGRRTPVRSRVQVPPFFLSPLSLPPSRLLLFPLSSSSSHRHSAPVTMPSRHPLLCLSSVPAADGRALTTRSPFSLSLSGALLRQSPLLMGVPRSFLVGAEDDALPCTLR